MYILLLFATLFLAMPKDIDHVLLAIRKLHKTTQYSTFYEVLGVSETTSQNDIRKAYFRMMKQKKAEASETKDRQGRIETLTEAYNILRNKKFTYDFVLANSYIYLGDQRNFKNNMSVTLLSIVFGLFVFDSAIFLARYLRFLTTKENRNPGKKNTKTDRRKPFMLSIKILSFMKSSIRKRFLSLLKRKV